MHVDLAFVSCFECFVERASGTVLYVERMILEAHTKMWGYSVTMISDA